MHKLFPVINHYGEYMMKHWKILVGAAAIALAVNASFAGAVKPGIPKGWSGHGAIAERYESGIDAAEGTAEHPAFFIAAKDAGKEDFAAISQVIDATPYRGKLVKFSMMLLHLPEDATQSKYEVWLRATDSEGRAHLGVSNLDAKTWREVSVGMTISEEISKLEFGIGLLGRGKIFMRETKLEGMAIPKDHAKSERRLANMISKGEMKAAVQNLNFSE